MLGLSASRSTGARRCAAIVTGLALSSGPGSAAAAPVVVTDRSCYVVGQTVSVTGSGFAPSQGFAVTIDGRDFGRSRTDAAGAFMSPLRPGGLPAGMAERAEHLLAVQGALAAQAVFTVTRRAGGRLIFAAGPATVVSAPVEVWGFSTDGRARTVWLHYIDPSGHPHAPVRLGRTRGQCGALRTASRRVLPFAAQVGTWTLQLDTRRRYARRPRGPVVRITVRVGPA